VVLGLFAISQAFYLLQSDDEKIRLTKLRGGLFQGLRELARHPRVATVSGSFGVLMGMIPGVGEFTAQFLGYTYAQRTSKRPEDFGRGSSEGLIASETANNAVPAAAMVPLLALGIPGEALTAMMLSVFYVHNVVPGPQLFQNQMDFVVALYIALLILNVMVLVFLLFATNHIIKLIKIPNRFLGVCILTLSFVGVYSLRNSMSDCVIAAVFGLIGFVLKRLSLPVIPIILGMVLGNIMEVKLRAGMARVKTPFDFIDRPVAMILFLLIIMVVILHIRRVIADRKELKEAKWSNKHASTNFGMHLSRRRDYLSTERGKAVRAKHLTSFRQSTDKSSQQ
jgi:putative tricarboxylic transport membrane protein